LLQRISLAAVLFVFWLLLSGYFTPFLLAAGIGSVVAVLALSQRMGVLDREGHPIHLGGRALAYWAWLAWEMAKAAWDVTKLILGPRDRISPTLVRVRPTQASELGQVIYANSITLTPGTISLELEDGAILVHALTREAADGLAGGDMDRRVTRLEHRS
jgi:multicomponent Na+:H+ antiporter subunit E